MQALQILGKAWSDEADEIKNNRPYVDEAEAKENVMGVPNTWDGKKDGTTENAQSFMKMLRSVV